MSDKFTQGPLSVHRYGENKWCDIPGGENHKPFRHAEVVVGSGDKIVATFTARQYPNGDRAGFPEVDSLEEMRANAALFMAAPALLEAARRALRFIENRVDEIGAEQKVDMLRAAIDLAGKDLA